MIKVSEILKDLQISDHQGISFEKFLLILKETERKMVSMKGKPDFEKFGSAQLATKPMVQQADELIIELDAKVMDFLR